MRSLSSFALAELSQNWPQSLDVLETYQSSALLFARQLEYSLIENMLSASTLALAAFFRMYPPDNSVRIRLVSAILVHRDEIESLLIRSLSRDLSLDFLLQTMFQHRDLSHLNIDYIQLPLEYRPLAKDAIFKRLSEIPLYWDDQLRITDIPTFQPIESSKFLWTNIFQRDIRLEDIFVDPDITQLLSIL